MNQLLQEQIAPPLKKSVKIKQIAAAILLIIALIIPCIRDISMIFFKFDFLYEHLFLFCNLMDISSVLLSAIGFIILSTIPLNRPTKLMMYTLIGIELLLSPLFLNIILNTTSFLLPIRDYIYYVIVFSCICIALYAYSIIIENNSISPNAIKWVNILCIATIVKLHMSLYNLFVYPWLQASFDRENWGTVFNINYGFSYIWLILMIIAYVKFCRCKAFDGNADTNGSATISYSPLNKYTASLFITTIVIIGTLIVYYKFIAPELMNLNI